MLDLFDVTVTGALLSASFLQDGLRLPPPAALASEWNTLQPKLRSGTAQRVHTSVLKPLAAALGYDQPTRQSAVVTREGAEDGGWLLRGNCGATLRGWSFGSDVDLDAPVRAARFTPMRTARFTPMRIAQRTLLANGEGAGLLTNGVTLHLLLCDPHRADGLVAIDIASWQRQAEPPESFRLLHALAAADALPKLPLLLDEARLYQTRVTRELRRQARDAITGFINAIPDRTGVAAEVLWREALVLVYRVLFILKLEHPSRDAAGFSFASTGLWQQALSPSRTLAPLVRRHLDQDHGTGRMLETGLRLLFSVFCDGLTCSELRIAPLGGALFGANTTPVLDRLQWGDRVVALLLDNLVWATAPNGERVRVNYGALGVEELGGVYEALLEQEPCIATEPLCRTRTGRQEIIGQALHAPPDILPGAFFLRAGLGRKSSGSFYTPHEFVRFMVRETLAPKVEQISPEADPHPARLLRLKLVDPGMGSGHFLVEACRFLAEALLTACRIADERGLHDRIAALPDPDQTLAAYLPSRGWSEARARAICRRMIAVHCLYGCDRNHLAVELAKLSLWLESFAEGLPLTFLDHRLVTGDALTAPFFDDLATLPVTGGPLDPLLASGIADRMNQVMQRAIRLVQDLDGSIGQDIADLTHKQGLKQRLDALLHPLRQLARAWAGAAMSGARDADDVWLALAQQVVDTAAWPARLNRRQQALLDEGVEALPWDLTFPEARSGFTAVLGNPPWDIVLANTVDFVAGHDPSILDAPPSQRSAIVQTVLARPGMAAAFASYRSGFERLKRAAARLYRHQRTGSGRDTTAGNLDLFRLFAERSLRLCAPDGALGLLLPSAFHSNEGATALRRLFLRETSLEWCLSFENRRRIFEIDSRFKFDIVIARRPGPTKAFRSGFYLERIEDVANAMTYDVAFLETSSGANLTPLEVRRPEDLTIARRMFTGRERVGAWCAERNIRLGRDLHMSGDAACFQPPGVAELVLHEGKTFHQYTDRWHVAPRYSVAPEAIRPAIAEAARHHRLAFRDIARATDERTMIACIAPPGTVFGHTASVEKTPGVRDLSDALVLCAIFNSFAFDWLVRLKAATHLSLYLLNALPMPELSDDAQAFLAAAARALCEHHDQPALRGRIDAVVARGYGLARDDYAHLLGCFSHQSWPSAPAVCLSAFADQQADRQLDRRRPVARRRRFARQTVQPLGLTRD